MTVPFYLPWQEKVRRILAEMLAESPDGTVDLSEAVPVLCQRVGVLTEEVLSVIEAGSEGFSVDFARWTVVTVQPAAGPSAQDAETSDSPAASWTQTVVATCHVGTCAPALELHDLNTSTIEGAIEAVRSLMSAHASDLRERAERAEEKCAKIDAILPRHRCLYFLLGRTCSEQNRRDLCPPCLVRSALSGDFDVTSSR